MLTVTATIASEAAECKAALESARQLMRVHSKSFETCRFALLRIDAIFWAGFDKVVRLPTSDELGGSL